MSEELIPIIVFVAVLAAAAMLAFASGLTRNPARRVSQRMQRVAAGDRAFNPLTASPGQPVGDGSVRRDEGRTASSLDKVLTSTPRVSQLKARIMRANLNFSVTEFLLGCFLLTAVTAALVYFVAGMPLLIALAVGGAVGFFMPNLFLNFAQSRRSKKFLKLFPDALDLIVRAIKAGIPVSEAMISVGTEVADPVGEEFRLIADKLRIGILLEDALLEAVERIGIEDFRFFVVTLNIQRDTGGNLAETLENLSDIIRKRQELRLKVRALSSEARASAYILGALPFVTAGILMVTNPNYLMNLFTDPFGHILIGVGFTMLSIGFFVMWRMVNFEI
ncbi:type II secretion system F family protein [Zavarzinia sp. CC-PAN008]|uniref:type II secretion system F family protein n=1 Tax=Zavarzinia sp. CC-PAN008 TaxID=3243332 RepID=UPI003F744F4B